MTVFAGVATYVEINSIFTFILTAVALVLLAMNVGHATQQLGNRMGPAVTGILQSALGNLPELFVAIFALRAGLDKVVQAALVGSILGNSLLVFGLAVLLGGLKNGTQKFNSEPPKMMATLMLLAFAALAIPSLASRLHTPAAANINKLDIMVAIVLLLVFAPVLWLLLRAPLFALIGSLALYCLTWKFGWRIAAYPYGSWAFNPFAWQLLPRPRYGTVQLPVWYLHA